MDTSCETNTYDDPTNCGGCGTTCNADEYCMLGTCTTCSAGLLDCDLDGSNGCESDTSSDPLNCNGCGTVCGDQNGGLCCSSTCVVPSLSDCGACGEPCFEGFATVGVSRV